MSFDPTAYDLSNSRIPYDPARTGEYVVAVRALDREFRADLEKARCPAEFTPKLRETLSEKAWELGHAKGYAATAHYYSQLVEVATAALAENRPAR